MQTIFINIKSLLQTYAQTPPPKKGAALQHMESINNAFLLVEDGKIKSYGNMQDCPTGIENCIDASGKYIFPTWCDSHTHIVFAASREDEFLMKIEGKSYEEIAAQGGGILNSAEKMAHISEDELFNHTAKRLQRLIQAGTGAIEIKSGYGLTTAAELKMLRVIQRLKQHFKIPIKATFLGAHAFPAVYKNNHEGYIQLIIDEMLPAIANEKLADYIDVFCENGFFSVDETNRILQAGSSYGLKAKIHANQLSITGAAQVGIQNNAISVDHLEMIDDAVIQALSESETIATLLPSCSFFLGIPYAPARALIHREVAIALASDYNPGSSPSGHIPFLFALACIKMKLKPYEALNALTINGAYAMEVQDEVGTITPGKNANFIITKPMPSLHYMPYSFGENSIESVYINGELV
jgi:imidazolonepropionase